MMIFYKNSFHFHFKNIIEKFNQQEYFCVSEMYFK